MRELCFGVAREHLRNRSFYRQDKRSDGKIHFRIVQFDDGKRRDGKGLFRRDIRVQRVRCDNRERCARIADYRNDRSFDRYAVDLFFQGIYESARTLDRKRIRNGQRVVVQNRAVHGNHFLISLDDGYAAFRIPKRAVKHAQIEFRRFHLRKACKILQGSRFGRIRGAVAAVAVEHVRADRIAVLDRTAVERGPAQCVAVLPFVELFHHAIANDRARPYGLRDRAGMRGIVGYLHEHVLRFPVEESRDYRRAEVCSRVDLRVDKSYVANYRRRRSKTEEGLSVRGLSVSYGNR